MRSKFIALVVAGLLLAACSREATQSDGNGPGNADGLGGREDPQTAPAMQGNESESSAETTRSEPQPNAQ
jgi:hypothetical protein